MNIVVLDGYTLNPGDLDWGPLEVLGNCRVFPRTKPTQVIERAATAEILFTNKVVLNADTIRNLPALKFIGVLATGYNVVDVEAARERGITVCNVPGYGTQSVAQHTFALILELCHRIGSHSEGVRSGSWSASEDFCYWAGALVELHGLTLGIVGYGEIGRAVGMIGRAFGMHVIATNRSGRPLQDAECVDLDTLFQRSDVVSLHCPLTQDNTAMINATRLAQMKPTAFLVNTARGPLINEADLATALNEGRIGGAALDVLATEPPPDTNPLLSARNCIISPHIAWATRAARQRLLNITIQNLRAFLAGTPQNRV